MWEAILSHEECGNAHLAKALFESNNGSSFINLEASHEEPSLPMECLTSQDDPNSPSDIPQDGGDLRATNCMDQTATENRFREEQLSDSASIRPEIFSDGAASALGANSYLSSSCADFSEGAVDQCKTAKRHQQDHDCAVLLHKKEKKAKKVFYQQLTGLLSASAKQQLPLPGGKKNALNSSKPVRHMRNFESPFMFQFFIVQFKEGPKLMARRGSAPTTYQPHAQLDISRLKRSCNLMNFGRNNTFRISKYSDQNGCGLRRRGSLPYDIGRRFSASEWSMGPKLTSEATDSDVRRDSASPSVHSTVNASRCKAPAAERLIGKVSFCTYYQVSRISTVSNWSRH